jgi:hypothetical protein
VQGWLRHSQLSTTLNVYIHEVDDGLGSAEAWNSMIGAAWGHPGATGHPGTPANQDMSTDPESALQSQHRPQRTTAASVRAVS